MKNKINSFFILITILSITFFAGVTNANAATVSISSSASPSTVVVGNKVTITVRISSATSIGSWYYNLSYNSDYLRINSGSVTVADSAENSTTKSKTYTYSFTAVKAGSVTVAVKNASVLAFTDESSMAPSISNANVKIITQAQLEATYSSNNKLSALSISGGSLSPTFNTDVTSYAIELAPNTTTVNVAATAADGKTSIAGAGDIAVVDGANTINVVVTAQNGTTKTYTINATVKELSPIEVKIGKDTYTIARKKSLYEAPKDFTESSIKIGTEDVLAYTNNKVGTVLGLKDINGKVTLYLYDIKTKVYKPYNSITINGINLYLKEITDKSIIPLGYIKTTLKIAEQSIEAYNYKNDDNYYLINGVNTASGIETFYLYDKEKGTIQRFYNDQVIDINNDYNKMQLIAIIASAIAIILILINIISLIRKMAINPKKQSKDVLVQDSYIEVPNISRSNKKKR